MIPLMLRESFFGLINAPLELHLKLDGRVAVPVELVDVEVGTVEVGTLVLDGGLVLDDEDDDDDEGLVPVLDEVGVELAEP